MLDPIRSGRGVLVATALLATLAACADGEIGADDSLGFQAGVQTMAERNNALADVGNENALGAVNLALTSGLERAELLLARSETPALRALGDSLREQRAALIIAVNEAAVQAGVQLDPPADSAPVTTVRESATRPQLEAIEALRAAPAETFDAAYVEATIAANRATLDALRRLEAPALDPIVRERVAATIQTFETENARLASLFTGARTSTGAGGA